MSVCVREREYIQDRRKTTYKLCVYKLNLYPTTAVLTSVCHTLLFPPQKLPDAPEEVEGVSRSELERSRQLAEDNQVLRRQLEELRSSRQEEVDHNPGSGEMDVGGMSIKKQGKQVAMPSSEIVEALRKENKSLVGENDSLKTQVKQLAQVGSASSCTRTVRGYIMSGGILPCMPKTTL